MIKSINHMQTFPLAGGKHSLFQFILSFEGLCGLQRGDNIGERREGGGINIGRGGGDK